MGPAVGEFVVSPPPAPPPPPAPMPVSFQDAAGVVWHTDGPGGRVLPRGWRRVEPAVEGWEEPFYVNDGEGGDGRTQWEAPQAGAGEPTPPPPPPPPPPTADRWLVNTRGVRR